MGGFIVGGLVGAAAAMYFSKNNRPNLAAAINWDQALDTAGKFVKSAKNMWDTTSIVQMNSDMEHMTKEKPVETH